MGKAKIESHIATVRTLLRYVAEMLRIRGDMHDASKLQEPELSGYLEMQDAFKNVHYGSPEYTTTLMLFMPVVNHHYKLNTHHPEHWELGVADMDLLDVIEMLIDWKAVSLEKRNDFEKSLEISIQRFEIEPQLASILRNTAKRLVL
jgi:hypothetical protein